METVGIPSRAKERLDRVMEMIVCIQGRLRRAWESVRVPGTGQTCQVGMVLVRPAATYTYSHGVVYVGGFQNDQFHGPGAAAL